MNLLIVACNQRFTVCLNTHPNQHVLMVLLQGRVNIILHRRTSSLDIIKYEQFASGDLLS